MEKIPVRHTGAFSIRDIATLADGKDLVQELHRHSFFYILVLEKGRGEHHIDFISYPVSNYSVFFMRPGQVHQLILKNGSTGFLLEFTDAFKVNNKPFYQANANGFKRLYSILTDIFQEYSAKQERYQEVIHASLNIFFIELLRQSRDARALSKTGSHEYMQERLEELLALIETHISTHKQVADYAEKLNLSGYQLNAITRATLGKTCSAVITDQIILEAKRQLLATTSQINQIAGDLGYEDVSYFIRFFKKHTGHSPEAFRQKFK
jgi:AraC-like DNA-binding protein